MAMVFVTKCSPVRFLPVILLWILTCVFTSEDVVEYCEWETFNATCSPNDEVLLIRSARYGRMKVGRCLTSFYPGLVCSRDVTSVLDGKCSGRNRCSVAVLTMHDWHCGSSDFKNYLEVSYECRKVANGRLQMCSNGSSIVYLPVAESHILANIFSVRGSEPCAYAIRVEPHQRINLTLTDFSVARTDQNPPRGGPVHSEPCRQVAIATELHDNGSTAVRSICGGRERETMVYMSTTNRVSIQFNQSYSHQVIIKYQVMRTDSLLASELEQNTSGNFDIPSSWMSSTSTWKKVQLTKKSQRNSKSPKGKLFNSWLSSEIAKNIAKKELIELLKRKTFLEIQNLEANSRNTTA